MTTEVIQLDDLTWNELTDSSRQGIAKASRGQWTHHAAVDPGVTLLELYASQLEQRLYWFDQPSDELRRALLSLFNVEPRPAESATTVMQLWTEPGVVIPPLIGKAGYSTSLREKELQFQAVDEINLFPVKVNYPSPNNSDSAAHARKLATPFNLTVNDEHLEVRSVLPNPIRLFDPRQSFATSRIQFELDGAGLDLSKSPTLFSLFLDLDTPESLKDGWKYKPDHSENKPDESRAKEKPFDCMTIRSRPESRTPIQFRLSLLDVNAQPQIASSEVQLEVTNLEDQTLGLQRSGLIRFHLPPQDLHRLDQRKQFALCAHLSADLKQFPFVPRIRQAIPNAVRSVHRVEHRVSPDHAKKIAEDFQSKRPEAQIDLLPTSSFPLWGGLLTTKHDVELRLKKDRNDAVSRWEPVSSFAFYQSSDRVFIPCRETSRLMFGDGIHGRIPICAKDSEYSPVVVFHWGGGEEGNVRTGLRWQPVFENGDSPTLNIQARNVVAGIGGSEAETLEEATRRCRSELKQPTRTVSKNEVEALAVKTPEAGIKRAQAVVGFHPSYPLVSAPGATTIFVIPGLPDSLRNLVLGDCDEEELVELKASASQLERVEKFLNQRRLITQELFVRPVDYERVEMQVRLSMRTTVEPEIQLETRRVLKKYVHPLFGGADGNGWSFGESLRPSEFVGFLNSQLDGNARAEAVGIRLCDLPNTEFEFCDEIPISPRKLPSLRRISIANVPTSAISGGLK